MTTKENRTIRPVNGIGPGATIGARKLAERRAEKLARERRAAAASAAASATRAVLTADELDALRQVEHGADVYGYGIARDLRAIQRKAPELVSIGKAQMYRGNGVGVVPYFGAIATAAGRKVLREAGPADWHAAAQRELDAAAMGEEVDP